MILYSDNKFEKLKVYNQFYQLQNNTSSEVAGSLLNLVQDGSESHQKYDCGLENNN